MPTIALMFVGALTLVLATAPRAAEDPYTTPAGERPLPWEYDYKDVASYWAQRQAPGRPGRQTHARMLNRWQALWQACGAYECLERSLPELGPRW